jgi:integrase
MPRINGTPKVRFNLLDRKAAETYVFAFFHYRGGQRLKYSAGEKVRPAFWNEKSQRLRLDKRHPEHTDINLSLNNLELTIIQIFRDFNSGDISPADFRKELDYRLGYAQRPESTQEKVVPFFEFIEDYISKKKVQPRGTWKILQVVMGLLKSYASERKGALDYADIDLVFFSDFKAWLFAPPRLHSINYAAKVMAIVRQFMRAAEDECLHKNTTYQSDKFKIKKIKTSKVVLSFEELEGLYSLDLSNDQRLERVRDLFLIGAYTGLRFSDFTRISPEHIEIAGGETVLNITTQKTGAMVSIPLFPIPLALLQKYNFSAPTISNQKMNDYLKELGKRAGMTGKMILTGSKGGKREDTTSEKWEKLTTHVARRSFATNFYRDGTPPIILMKITGHTTEQQFMQYIAIDGKENALHFADLRKG